MTEMIMYSDDEHHEDLAADEAEREAVRKRSASEERGIYRMMERGARFLNADA